jgi:SAM-dependent methyltransferase
MEFTEFIYKYLYFSLPRLGFLKCAKGHKYLDFGCGGGVALRQNLESRPDLKCFCIDVKDFSKALPKNVVFTVYDGINIPYKEDTFEIITANHVLEHVHNPIMILLELKRIMKAGGSIFIEVPNKRSLWGKPCGRFAGTVHFKDDPTHIRPYSKKDLTELCRNAGFKVIRCGISRNLLHLFLSPFLLVVGLLMPEKLYFMYARNSLIGWSSYIILKK